MSVEVGQQAPDFTLKNQHGEEVTLSSYRGEKNVVLVFYPFAFSPTCTGELCAIRDEQTSIEGDDTIVLGISCDPMWALRVYAEQQNFDYQLLSDFWPHGGVAQQYGAFLEEKGFSTRATFVINKDGVVSWAIVNSPADARSTDEYRAAIAALAA
jgi:mycoredoxin-dependent peroxiredoxin